jgi:hypothetical protein
MNVNVAGMIAMPPVIPTGVGTIEIFFTVYRSVGKPHRINR